MYRTNFMTSVSRLAKPLLGLLLGMVLCLSAAPALRAAAVSVSAEDYADEELNTIRITNPDTGYSIYVEDGADLIPQSETRAIVEKMYETTGYGGAALITTEYNSLGSTKAYTDSCYDRYFGKGSGIIFVIDMDNRELWLSTDGAVRKIVTDGLCDSITDNVYTIAGKGDYAACALETFSEISAVLSGAKIAQPMKYVSNALIALSLALLVNFAIVSGMSRLKSASDAEILASANSNVNISQPDIWFVRETKTYSPVSSGSSGGGGGGGGRSGGGGGGGGHGGGGHRF